MEPRFGSTGDAPLDSTFQDCFKDAMPSTWSHQSQRQPSLQLQERLESLEFTLAEVVEGLRDHRAGSASWSSRSKRKEKRRRRSSNSSMRNTASGAGASTAASPSSADGATSTISSPNDPRVPWESAETIAELFLMYCDCQPLPLFHRQDFVSTFANRDTQVVYAVIALVSRFSDRAKTTPLPTAGQRQMFADAAHRSVMAQIASGRVELSTLQTLCLLTLNGFQNGEIALSRVHRSLAMTLVHSARLHQEPVHQGDERIVDERRRCYWSVILLQQLLGETVSVAGSELSQATMHSPQFPTSATTPSRRSATEGGQFAAASPSAKEQEGILYVILKLSEVWSQVQEYTRSRGASENDMPPWSPQSAYSKTVESIMNLGPQLPSMHRYRFIRISRISTQDLEESRDYWAPWLLSRLIYHTSICMLNHPILIMLQIQGQHHVSELFLQHTTFQRDHHTSWVVHFIKFLQSRRFYVSDPMFAYCAAVVATIELYQSFVGDDQGTKTPRAQESKQNYEECLAFILSLHGKWPSLVRIADSLERLSQDMAVLYENNMAKSDENINIDISSFFSILDLSRFCAPDGSVDVSHSVFGPTLAPCPAPETPRSANLQRLPRITEMESSDSTAVEQSGIASHLISTDQGIFLPADQFFDGLQGVSMSLWDDGLDEATTAALDLNAVEF
ncbi:unnamed protein product [Clonostachys rosea f. rosea IK726]|uniref:Uncharacterized protein n=1 Tax=Clonostachys rosea f. rosea IK726 TaxID=1349383 RepID=A0ACA9UQ54_BIOOC|nr:unnamed protein product [Clonostachys rosea f. rosea IK726]